MRKEVAYCFGEPKNGYPFGVLIRLYFDDWKWFQAIQHDKEVLDECELSGEDVRQWAKTNLQRAEWSCELRFIEQFEFPLLLTVRPINRQFTFSPQGWRLLGDGTREWDYSFEGFAQWSAEEFLFEKDGTFLLIAQQRYWEAPLPSDPYGQRLSAEQAARWCEASRVSLPLELEPYRTVYELTPESLEAFASSVPDPSFGVTRTSETPPAQNQKLAGVAPPPPWNKHDGEWMYAAELARILKLDNKKVCDHRKGADSSRDEHGVWGIDDYGVFRRRVGGEKFAAYYLPQLKPIWRQLYEKYVEKMAEG